MATKFSVKVASPSIKSSPGRLIESLKLFNSIPVSEINPMANMEVSKVMDTFEKMAYFVRVA